MKIAIVGSALTSRSLAPFGDPEWQIWALSPRNMDLPRVDLWFELHANLLEVPRHRASQTVYLDWLKAQSFDLYMVDNSLIERAMPFPKDALVARFGRRFFTSSVAWMLALAIDRGAETIGLWGVDMSTDEEYVSQRGGCHYFIEQAEKAGIAVLAPMQSDILEPPPLYGFDTANPLASKITAERERVLDMVADLDKQMAALRDKKHHFEGVLDCLTYMQRTWSGYSGVDPSLQGPLSFPVEPPRIDKVVPIKKKEVASA